MAAPDRISIRPYRATDLDAVITIYQRAIREVAIRDYNQDQVNAWSQVDRTVWTGRRLSRPTWVAWIGTDAAGFTDLEPDGHLDMMFVHPNFQGRGVAKALVHTVLQAARAQGLTRIFTEASLTARPFFERCGFALIAAQDVETRGQKLRNFQMEWRDR